MYFEIDSVVDKEVVALPQSDLYEVSFPEIAEKRLPTTWEEFLQEMQFADPRLVAFKKNYWEFYLLQKAKEDQTIRLMMDEVLTRTYQLYPPEEAYEICRFYVFITVLTQKNEVLSASGRDQTVRKKEKDAQGNLHPTIKHTTEVYLEGLTIDGEAVDSATAMTLKDHDVYEDCGMFVEDEQGNKTQEWIGKDTLLDIIESEFKYKEELSIALLGMSKYDLVPEEIRIASQDSLLYDCLDHFIAAAYKREGKMETIMSDPELWEKHHDDIMKTITSILRLRYEHYLQFQITGDKEAYLTGVMRDMYVKGKDITVNLPDVSYAGRLRARLMATLMRVLHMDISNQIMHKLALSTEDALFDTLQNKPLAEQLNQGNFKEDKDNQMEQFINEKLGISANANLGYRISFLDEVANSEEEPYAAFQTLVEVDPENYDELIAGLKAHINNPALQAFIEGKGELRVEEFNGVLQKIIEVLGRKNCMFEIKDETGHVLHYIRIVEREPRMSDRILLNRKKVVESPEDKFFAPPRDPSTAIQKFLNMQLLLFNAEYLKGKGDRIAVLIWDGGVTTFATTQELRDASLQLGITEDEYSFVELMEETNSIDWENPPSYPFYYAKRRDTVNSPADFLQSV